MHTYLYHYLYNVCVVQIKGILKNRTQIEEWIEDKAIRRRWRNLSQQDGSDEEEEEEESSSDEVGQEKTTKEKASKQNKKTHSKPFVYPYDLGWKRNLSQVSGGELYALHTLVVDVQVAVAGWVMPQVSSPHFTYICTCLLWRGLGILLTGIHFTPTSSGCS